MLSGGGDAVNACGGWVDGSTASGQRLEARGSSKGDGRRGGARVAMSRGCVWGVVEWRLEGAWWGGCTGGSGAAVSSSGMCEDGLVGC